MGMSSSSEKTQPSVAQPAAYDVEGRPLYHHPPQVEEEVAKVARTQVTSKPEAVEGHNFKPQIRTQYAAEQDLVHAKRPRDPEYLEVGEEARRKHNRSHELYPHLNLSEGEHVILDIKRHPIGMLAAISVTFALLVAIFAFVAVYPSLYDSSIGALMPAPSVMFVICLLGAIIAILGGVLALWVYLQNQFFMTNESVIQEVQYSPFSRREQTVSLGSIEDASFRQQGIIQTVLDYGTIRLSTEGEETTYIFHYVSNPKHQIATLNNAIEDFKNGRPVVSDD